MRSKQEREEGGFMKTKGFAKVFLSLAWLEWIDRYWDDYEKRSLSRKWQSFQRSGHWF